MILLQQWSDVVVIILREVSESLLKRIQNVSLVSREEVLLIEVVVREGLHGMLLPWSVPYFRIEIPIEVHFKLIIYSSLCCQRGEFSLSESWPRFERVLSMLFLQLWASCVL